MRVADNSQDCVAHSLINLAASANFMNNLVV
jgi:hypothetical protein